MQFRKHCEHIEVWKKMATIFQMPFSYWFCGKQNCLIRNCWFTLWCGIEKVPSHCLNQWWPSSLMHTPIIRPQWVNSLGPGRFQFNFRLVTFKLILVNGGWDISYEIALKWMPLDLTDDKSTLVQVMAWCHQATSHYLSQCWHRSMSPNGVTRPQWVNGCLDIAPCPFINIFYVVACSGFVALSLSVVYLLWWEQKCQIGVSKGKWFSIWCKPRLIEWK